MMGMTDDFCNSCANRFLTRHKPDSLPSPSLLLLPGNSRGAGDVQTKEAITLDKHFVRLTAS